MRTGHARADSASRDALFLLSARYEILRQLSDQTSAHFEEQLGQRHFKCFDLEPTSYTLKS